jgi:hypothetical protein
MAVAAVAMRANASRQSVRRAHLLRLTWRQPSAGICPSGQRAGRTRRPLLALADHPGLIPVTARILVRRAGRARGMDPLPLVID